MKANLLQKTLWIVAAILFSTTVSAQADWKKHQAAPRSVSETNATSGDLLTIGYSMGWNETIYQGDGYSFNEPMRIGAAALITKSMIKDYAGGRIVALRLGWNATTSTGFYDGFITKGINGEQIGSCSGKVTFGWNVLYLDEPYEIPEGGEDLFAGFYTNVPKDVCCIPTLFPERTPNSCFLWNESLVDENGEKQWQDFSLIDKPIAIHLVIEDKNGAFTNLVSINSLIVEEIATTETNGTAHLTLQNKGTNDVRSIEVTTQQGDQSQSTAVSLSRILVSGNTSDILVPVYCFGTGKHSLRISKINGTEVSDITPVDFNLIGIPASVSKEYTMRPLLEWFVSENSYTTPKYTDEIFYPGYQPFTKLMTLVCQHFDDQFMTGEDDDATRMLLDFVNNDSSAVSIPAVMVNRAYKSSHPANSGSGPATPALYPQYAMSFYQEVVKTPTFASVNITANLDEAGENAQIKVSGNIAEGIMPENEPLYLTVYLMENDVTSDSQIFWDDKEESGYQGLYTHKNIIRQVVTPFYGEQLANNSGDYSLAFETEVDPEWNKDNLEAVAFINRSIKNGNFSAQVINSNVVPVNKDASAINHLEAGNTVTIKNGSFSAGQGNVEVFTLDGRQVPNSHLNAGAYIVKVNKGGKQTVRKMLIK